MLFRHALIGVMALSGLLLAGVGCQSSSSETVGLAEAGNDKELLVFVTDNAVQVREKAESYGLKVKTIDAKSTASQLVQTLLNSPSEEYFAVINPVIKRYIAGGAISDEIDPFEIDNLFRRLKQVSKAGANQLQRLSPETKGNARLLVFSDFQCPFCQKMEEILPKLKSKYGENLEIDFAHFPLPSHELAFEAAEASECAREQNRFEEYKAELFSQQKSLSDYTFQQIARKLQLDRKQFSKCLSLHQQRKKVRQDQYFGQYMGIHGTPTLVLNGEMLSGIESPEQIEERIDKILPEHSSSPAPSSAVQAGKSSSAGE